MKQIGIGNLSASSCLVFSGLRIFLARRINCNPMESRSLGGTGLRKAMTLSFDGLRLFETVQATWNLLEPSAGPALSEAHAAGMGVIVKEALANGRLTSRNPDPGFAPKLEILRREAARFHSPVEAIALASCLAQPFADVVLSGAVAEEQVLSNVRSYLLNLDTDAMSRLMPLAEPAQSYWATRKNLPWN
jgi:aryl-alcohol dehydrogenase-like predicted oxidoreductase